MINKNTMTKFIVGLGSSALLVGFTLTASASTITQQSRAAALPQVIARSDTAITARITALNNLSTRIAAIKNVPANEKSNIAAEVQTETANLTTLKGKIDADTDVTTARADAKTITGDYRIYALVIPQGYITASSDRIQTIVGLMTALQAKLQTRVTAAQTVGSNVTTFQAALTDITAKLADANSQAQTAQTGVALLVPDQGNATVAASNKAALVAARGNIKTATQDLKTVRSDIRTMTQGLKIK